MSHNDDGDLEEYVFQGNDGEEVPRNVEKLIVTPGIQVLPEELCYQYENLQEVSIPIGLISIGGWAFNSCRNLLEIRICHTVQQIGMDAFRNCTRLRKVEFENSTTSSPHNQLRRIDECAFNRCSSLSRIKLPSSVSTIYGHVFASCESLVEANLSTTTITEIPGWTFGFCWSLQTVGLPRTLEIIGARAFYYCSDLVTVVVRLDSQPIWIWDRSFEGCRQLANLMLPKDSKAEKDSFDDCGLLHDLYGSTDIIAGLTERFEDFSIHRMCYDHSGTTAQELRQRTEEQQEENSFVDELGMTPFHVLFSTVEPRIELLEVLLDSLPNPMILNCRDCNNKRPLEYLVANWTNSNTTLFQKTLQKCVVDRLVRWGATSWLKTMQSKVQDILAENDNEQRAALCDDLCSNFEHFENVQAISILEMALWKWKLKSGWTSDGSKRQALDREECRCLSGSDVVIPRIAKFLDIP